MVPLRRPLTVHTSRWTTLDRQLNLCLCMPGAFAVLSFNLRARWVQSGTSSSGVSKVSSPSPAMGIWNSWQDPHTKGHWCNVPKEVCNLKWRLNSPTSPEAFDAQVWVFCTINTLLNSVTMIQNSMCRGGRLRLGGNEWTIQEWCDLGAF